MRDRRSDIALAMTDPAMRHAPVKAAAISTESVSPPPAKSRRGVIVGLAAVVAIGLVIAIAMLAGRRSAVAIDAAPPAAIDAARAMTVLVDAPPIDAPPVDAAPAAVDAPSRVHHDAGARYVPPPVVHDAAPTVVKHPPVDAGEPSIDFLPSSKKP